MQTFETYTTDWGFDRPAGFGYWFKMIEDREKDVYMFVRIYWPHGEAAFYECDNTSRSSDFDFKCDPWIDPWNN